MGKLLAIMVLVACTAYGNTFRQTNFQDVAFKEFLNPDTKAVALIFMGTECPLVKQYIPTLKRLNTEYKAKGIRFLGVYSDKSVRVFNMAKHALEFDVPFTVVQDVESGFAGTLGVAVLSEAVLLDRSQQILYQGKIDDQFGLGAAKSKPTREFLKDAIEDVLAEREVAVADVPVRGCAIEMYNAEDKPEVKYYYGDVEPIMRAKCQVCHRAGEVAENFAFNDYNDAAAYGETIRQAVTDGRMPPSYTVTNHQFVKLRNDRRLSQKEVDIIDAWVKNGSLEGDKAKALPPANWPKVEWKIGKPDRVLTMEKPFLVPATGILDYQFFKMKLNYPVDKWVTAMEIRPGAPSVVHHAELHIVPSDNEDYSGTDGMMKVYGFTGDKAKMLAGFVPGDDDDNARVLEPGHAMKIPAHHDLVLELHYTTNGKATYDRSSAALKFTPNDGKPKYELCNHTFRYPRADLKLKAGDDHVSGTKELWFKKDVLLWTVRGHMHKLGKSWKLEWLDERPGEPAVRQLFAAIPTWSFGWQRSFDFEKPIVVPAGQVLLMTGTWDNSILNPWNDDPKKDKTWGIQSSDEMLNTRVKFTILNNEDGKQDCMTAVP